MKSYDLIQPEVIVGLGEKTEFEEKKPPFLTIKKLHINLEDWLGDDLMECHPAYIVTEVLKVALEKSDFSGFTFENMDVTKDEYFNNNYHQKKPLPKFYWMKINGQKNFDDLYIDNSDLLISENLLEFIKSEFTIKFSDIDPEHDKETDDFILSLIKRDQESK